MITRTKRIDAAVLQVSNPSLSCSFCGINMSLEATSRTVHACNCVLLILQLQTHVCLVLSVFPDVQEKNSFGCQQVLEGVTKYSEGL